MLLQLFAPQDLRALETEEKPCSAEGDMSNCSKFTQEDVTLIKSKT